MGPVTQSWEMGDDPQIMSWEMGEGQKGVGRRKKMSWEMGDG